MKVLFLVAAIAVCLMTFTPATEAAYPRSVSIFDNFIQNSIFAISNITQYSVEYSLL